MRALLISNPYSTTQAAGGFRQIISTLSDVEGLTMTVKFTHYRRHAEELVRGLTRKDYEAVIAVGGDGTVSEVVNGLLGPVTRDETGRIVPPDPSALPVLGVVPTGSANVFARALGFPAVPEEAAHVLSRLLHNDQPRTICLGAWNDRWFAVNAGFGLDADVLARVDRARQRGFAATPLRYLAISFQAYQRARFRPPRINVDATAADGSELRLEQIPLLLASNTNPWTFLGPLPVVTNPRNSFDEGLGLFGLTALSGIAGLVGLLHLFGADRERRLGTFANVQLVQFDDAVRVKLNCPSPHRFQADGEFAGKLTEVELESVSRALTVFAPADARPPHERSIGEVLRDLIRIR